MRAGSPAPFLGTYASTLAFGLTGSPLHATVTAVAATLRPDSAAYACIAGWRISLFTGLESRLSAMDVASV